MPRYKLTLEYDGRAFHGWQAQKGRISAQEALAHAAASYAEESPVYPYGAGRTDAGVHALGQVAHLDLAKEKDLPELKAAINFHLKPLPMVILKAERESPDFHARFSAKARHYLYKILNRPEEPTLEKGLFWHVRAPLSSGMMREVASRFLGFHDFTTFRSASCQAASPKKTLDALEVSQEGDRILIRARARSFLHHQVRSLVGALKKSGEGKWTPQDAAHALEKPDRALCPPLAPAHGLYLERVIYDEDET